jgi:ORF6N domain
MELGKKNCQALFHLRQAAPFPGADLLPSCSMTKNEAVALDQIQSRIFVLRGHRVLLDMDLAAFYGVPTKSLNRALKRNANRFPDDFCFQLTIEEVTNLRYQIGTSSLSHGGHRYRPFAFTEHGALMAANVLNSPHAVQMSLVVVRAFFALRRMILDHKALSSKLAELDARIGVHDEQLVEIVEAIRYLTSPEGPEHGRKIGFNPENQ